MGSPAAALPRPGVFSVVLLGAWMAACGARSSLVLVQQETPDTGVTMAPDTGMVDASMLETSTVDASIDAEDVPDADGGPSCSMCCNSGYTLVGGVCTLVVASIPAPRAIAPLSTAIVTSQAPLLTWALATGNDGAVVDICRDRACTAPVTSFVALGTNGAPPAALAKGVYFWRLRGTENGAVGTVTSPVWELFVGARSAPVNTSWGTTPDVNGDGFADVIVGAPQANDASGAVTVYLGGDGGLSTTPATTLTPPTTGRDPVFGSYVASAGDVNGDGFADVIVGAPSMNVYTPPAAYVYLGGPGGLSTTPAVLGGAGTPFTVGGPVAGAGDVNRDGFADVVVLDTEAYVFLGSAGGLSTTPIVLAHPGVTSRLYYPESAAGAGDVNGDGYADIVVGGGMLGGYVYLGSPAGPSQTPDTLNVQSIQMDGDFGRAVASAGDVNGDGFADILVTDPVLNQPNASVFLFLGGPGGITVSTQPAATLSNLSGLSVAGAGDVNGDGFADVIGGTPYIDAALFLGGPGGLSTTPTPLRTPGFVSGVAGAGDVNGDGFADVICGSSDEVDVFLGTAGGVSTSVATLLMGPSMSGFGEPLASSVLRLHHHARTRCL